MNNPPSEIEHLQHLVSNLRRDLQNALMQSRRRGEVIDSLKWVIRDAQMHIEAENIDWSRLNEGPDHDPKYKPEFPEIVAKLSASFAAIEALEKEGL